MVKLTFFGGVNEIGGNNGEFKFGIDMVKVKTNKNDGEKLFLEAVEILQGEEPDASKECLWCNWNK